MAGIYIHIPFCRQACHYCDFHFSTNLSYVNRMTDCLAGELEARADYLENAPVETIYFGGGTPSLLTREALEKIMAIIRAQYRLAADPEITLEANPDDLNREKLQELRKCGINRLSIGLQTFDDSLLKFLNRAHDRQQGLQSVVLAREAGFSNISLDLIYAIPGEAEERLEKDLTLITSLEAEHVSAYGLTIEPATAFGNWYKKGKLTPVDEEKAASDYNRIMSHLRAHGFEHYEISNFGKPGFYSRHNSAYWKQKIYVGVGPGAHSYNLTTRRFNVSNNIAYMKGMEKGHSFSQTEELSQEDRINEYVLVSLRTRWGVDLNKLHSEMNYDLLSEQDGKLGQWQADELVIVEENRLRLTDKGKLLADQIAEDLFVLPPE